MSAIITLACVQADRAPAGEFDPATGYRIGSYRAPVDAPLEGGTRVSLDEVDALLRRGAKLIDVMPARAGYDPATGVWRLVEKRMDIPGSTWLPNTGFGALEAPLQSYFATQLRIVSDGDAGRPLIFYCLADCWMSWNAVKRAASLGYSGLYWFSEGTDGWSEAGRPLVEAAPPPLELAK